MNQSSYLEDMLSMKEDHFAEDSEVAEFYNGRNVLITGGSGFIGKLLIHKLFKSCPKLGKLFILMRPKKGKTSLERLQDMFKSPLYEKLHRDYPNFINRCVLIEGDTGERDLGLSPSDRNFIIENTDIVIHGAATVRFDDILRKVITINVKGTKLMPELARKMPRLKAFVHLSTAYSHIERKYIDEKIYEPPLSVDKALALIELLDDDALERLAPKVVGKFRKTYFFSKALSEEVVRLYGTGLPVCIVRPSIIVSTMYEPIRGWIDNIYGATGLAYLTLHLAILRTLMLDTSKVIDIVPADYVVNIIIVAAWDTNQRSEVKTLNSLELDKMADGRTEPPIYNYVSSCQNSLILRNFYKLLFTHGTEVISSKAMWYCIFRPTTNKCLHYIYIFFLHVVPALLVDTLARLTGRKAKLYDTTIKIQKFYDSMAFGLLQDWKYNNTNVLKLWDRLNSTDKILFDFNMKNVDWGEFFIFYTRGIRVYLVKDPMHNLEASITRYGRLKLAHFTMIGALALILLWIIGSYTRIWYNSLTS